MANGCSSVAELGILILNVTEKSKRDEMKIPNGICSTFVLENV
ncbi:hypothetical protein PORCAN_1479 [Porphyromonas crevioricanis JCM 13913]|nr:hypothetical protein PORCAN_1479 [Porphyromonas crevioricanis JCM 13913]